MLWLFKEELPFWSPALLVSHLLALFLVVLAPGPTPPPPACGMRVSFCLPPVTLDVPLELALAFPALPGPLCCLFLCCPACRILVSPLGIHPGPPAVVAQSPNHWTAWEQPNIFAVFF